MSQGSPTMFCLPFFFFFDEYSFGCCKFLNIFQNFNKAVSDPFFACIFSFSVENGSLEFPAL